VVANLCVELNEGNQAENNQSSLSPPAPGNACQAPTNAPPAAGAEQTFTPGSASYEASPPQVFE
jgi:hypothetical protein